MTTQTLRGAAFVLLAAAILLGRFAPEEWTWSGPVAAIAAVIGLVLMVVSAVRTRKQRQKPAA